MSKNGRMFLNDMSSGGNLTTCVAWEVEKNTDTGHVWGTIFFRGCDSHAEFDFDCYDADGRGHSLKKLQRFKKEVDNFCTCLEDDLRAAKE